MLFTGRQCAEYGMLNKRFLAIPRTELTPTIAMIPSWVFFSSHNTMIVFKTPVTSVAIAGSFKWFVTLYKLYKILTEPAINNPDKEITDNPHKITLFSVGSHSE